MKDNVTMKTKCATTVIKPSSLQDKKSKKTPGKKRRKGDKKGEDDEKDSEPIIGSAFGVVSF
jgi:hypothetical protein